MIYFIAAGKGSRMKSELPKALHQVNGEANLVRNVKLIDDDYRVVVNRGQEALFSNYVPVENILSIDSGLGSGHAIMQIPLKDDDIVIWGDSVILDTRIIDEIKTQDGFSIPLKRVKNPYVNFLCDKNLKIQEALFAKYGETSASGLQDCCIFKVTQKSRQQLEDLHNAIWKGRYITESNEFEYHYIMHYKSNINDPANGYITEYPNAIESYNTQDELKTIEKIIKG
jgi:bifunctional N-acetylglucosamine-1-phosphate-uridyltransferase/glucosamine-1-phosphate-acetyltransferase GlmU-like protein